MATLTLEAGNLTSQRTVGDSVLQEYVRLIFEAQYANPAADPMPTLTPQEKLDWFSKYITQAVRNQARELRKRELQQDNQQQVDDELGEDWT